MRGFFATGGQFRDVLACETLYPMGEAASVLVGDQRLDLPVVSTATPRRVLVMGDSGCRGDLPHKPQPCTGLEPGRAGAWTGAMVSETGRVLATCDSSRPRQGRGQSVCRLQ